MENRFGTNAQAEKAATGERSVAPWRTPGAAKEAWKSQGNYLDYRELKASRPADLVIKISGPRQFNGM